MKSKLKRMLALVLSALMLTIAAPVINESAGITAAAAEQKWDSSYDANNCSSFSIDKSTYHGKRRYSIKITNKKYNKATVSKKFAVKKNTDYRISVWVKTTGLKNDPNKTGKNPGAYLYLYTSDTPYYYWHNGKDWKKLEFIINSKSATELDISLRNGAFENYCKGTAWFSDFKIEEFVGKKTNEWNVLGVVFKNVNAPVVIDGKKQMYKDSLNDDDVKRITDTLNRLYTSIPLLSENKWKIKCIDVVATDAVINELGIHKDGYKIDFNTKCVSEELDRLIANEYKKSGKRYNQIIVLSPLDGVANGWGGLTGRPYKGINFSQVTLTSGGDWRNKYPNYPEGVFVHEMLHGLERVSNSIDPEKTEDLHNVEKLGYVDGMLGWDDDGAWNSDYMRMKTPSGKGIVPEAYDVYNTGKWKVIYGSKNTKPAKTDIASLKISKPSDYFYSGAKKCPSITVKDGKKKLVKGKDYKLTYFNNKEIGLATVVVEGIGKYTGKYAQNFRINPQKTTLKVTKSKAGYEVSWTPVEYAERYDVVVNYVKKNGRNAAKVHICSGTRTSATVTIDSSSECTFMVRSYKTIYPQEFISYSNTVKL